MILVKTVATHWNMMLRQEDIRVREGPTRLYRPLSSYFFTVGISEQ
ncbi:MAG: hypothetical protein ACK5WK_02915 [Hyphomonadaceae bacterium]